jgi:release factor glutamine methyltransferase
MMGAKASSDKAACEGPAYDEAADDEAADDEAADDEAADDEAADDEGAGRSEGAQTFGALRAAARAALVSISDTPALDADLLLAAVANVPRSIVLAYPERVLASGDAGRFHALLARRAEGVPLAYLLGRRDFFWLTLEVDAAVLVPRPETELLVEQALEVGRAETLRFLDLGTGSGAIALAVAAARRGWLVTAVDKSRAALAVASANGSRLGLEVEWLESDWFGALAGRRFDVIVCNPPYVASRDCVGPLRFEPRLALDGGADGLDAIRAVLAGARAHLEPGGRLLFEHGADQRKDVLAAAAARGFEAVDVRSDLAGRDRCVVLRQG